MKKSIFILKNYLLLIIVLFSQAGCKALKPKKVSAKDFPADPRERVKRNIEEGKGFRLLGGDKGGTNYEFASANPLWRATLETLDFMPLASANYSGGIVITDWYSENNSPNESVKISVRFLSNEVRSDALIVKVFYKNCSMQDNCKVSDRSDELSSELAKKILTKAAVYEKDTFSKKKKKYRNEALRTDEQDQ